MKSSPNEININNYPNNNIINDNDINYIKTKKIYIMTKTYYKIKYKFKIIIQIKIIKMIQIWMSN